jgi:hypothetical protein
MLWFSAGQWFSAGTLVFSTNKTNHHNITEILLKVALNTINQPTINNDIVTIIIKGHGLNKVA